MEEALQQLAARLAQVEQQNQQLQAQLQAQPPPPVPIAAPANQPKAHSSYCRTGHGRSGGPGEGVEDGALLPGRHTSLHVPATTPRRESGGQGPDKMAGVRLL